MKATIGSPGVLLSNEDPRATTLRQMIRELFGSTKRVVAKHFPYTLPAFNKVANASAQTFPGAQPISLCKEHIDQLCSEEFLCCEKSDGVRYLFLQTSDHKCYLMERKGGFYAANMEWIKVPERPPTAAKSVLSGLDCMVDGELVEDTVSGKRALSFLIYDVLWIAGTNYMAREYTERLRAAVPIICILRCESLDSMDLNRIHIYVKDLFRTQDIRFLMDKVIPTLCHKNDGIIFTKVDCPYYPATCQEILKWKPPEKNTIDCALQSGETSKFLPRCYELCCMGNEGRTEFFDVLFFKDPDDEKNIREQIKFLKNSSGAQGFAECFYDYEYVTEDMLIFKLLLQEENAGRIEEDEKATVPTKITKERVAQLRATVKTFTEQQKDEFRGGWRVERIRGDKENPNYIRIAKNVRKSINDKIMRDDLATRLENATPQKGTILANIGTAVPGAAGDEDDDDGDAEEEHDVSFDFIGKRKGAGEDGGPDQKKKAVEEDNYDDAF